MVCRKCQSVLAADSTFCPKCGQSVEPAVMPQAANQCPYCGRPMAAGAVFCVGCGQRVQQPQTQGYEPPAQKQKKSKKKPIMIGISVVLILVAVVAAGLLFFWLTDDDPGEAIADGLENTLDSGSFTVKYTASYADSWGDIEQAQGTVYVSIDTRNEELMAQIQVEDSDGEVQETYAIYDGYFTDGYYYEDVSEAIDMFFLAYEEDFDSEMLVAMLMNSLPSSYNEMLSQVVDQSKLEECVSQYEEKLNDERWLEEYAGYAKDDEGAATMYTFAPNIHTFLNGSLDVFETAFQNKYLYIGLKDMLRDLRTPAKNTQVRLTFGVKNERLVRLELTLGGTEDGLTEGETVKFRGDLSNFGNTYVDEDLLAQLLADAQYS